MRFASLFLALLVITPIAIAAGGASIAAEKSCPPAVPTTACHLVQSGTLEVVCAGQCDLLATGQVSATDSFPVKQLGVELDTGVLIASGGCIGAGVGTSTCTLDMRVPFLIRPGTCEDVTLTTTYDRAPFSQVKIVRGFTACIDAGGAFGTVAAS